MLTYKGILFMLTVCRHTIYVDCPLKGKGKAIPLQAWAGPKCSRRLTLPDLKTIGT